MEPRKRKIWFRKIQISQNTHLLLSHGNFYDKNTKNQFNKLYKKAKHMKLFPKPSKLKFYRICSDSILQYKSTFHQNRTIIDR